jgi:hypothetical protein
MGLSFTIAAGPRHRSHSQVRVPLLMAIFYSLRFETPTSWRARSPYLYLLGTGWPSYTPRHWFIFRPRLTHDFSSRSTNCLLVTSRQGSQRKHRSSLLFKGRCLVTSVVCLFRGRCLAMGPHATILRWTLIYRQRIWNCKTLGGPSLSQDI